ncbi:MAG: hypothetical protein AB1540_05560 [Bdellovibrionota bacterium]
MKAVGPSILKYTVSYDGVESERCFFSFQAKGMKGAGLEVAMTKKAGGIDPEARQAKPDEISLLSKTHKLCKKKSCGEPENDWGFHHLIGVTDLNKNGSKEFWFS